MKLSNKTTWKSTDYIQRIGSSFQDGRLFKNQKWFKRNYILQNLLDLYELILTLVFRSLYGLREIKGLKNLKKIASRIEKNDKLTQAKLPQILLKDFLDPMLGQMYTLFYLLEYRNPTNCALIMNNFKSFYEPLQLYRYKLTQILKEATENSKKIKDQMASVCEVVFSDLKLPEPQSGKVKHQAIKMILIKNILKNLLKTQKTVSRGVFRSIIQLWRKRVERIYYFTFEQYNEKPCVSFYLLQERVITKNPKAQQKIRDFRKSISSFFHKMTINISEGTNYTCFRLDLTKFSSKKVEHFRKFLKYYIEIKSLFYNLSSDLNVPLTKINPLEKVSQRGLILHLILNANLRWELRKSLTDFVVQVYLHVEKYNHFTDLHDFYFFLQNM